MDSSNALSRSCCCERQLNKAYGSRDVLVVLYCVCRLVRQVYFHLRDTDDEVSFWCGGVK